jgi:hypothetical protein
MESAGENVNDGAQVVDKLSLRFLFVVFVKNHEFASISFNDPFDKLKCDSCESVPVDNHKLFEISLHRGVQNGLKSSSPPVDSRRNVSDEVVIREL